MYWEENDSVCCLQIVLQMNLMEVNLEALLISKERTSSTPATIERIYTDVESRRSFVNDQMSGQLRTI